MNISDVVDLRNSNSVANDSECIIDIEFCDCYGDSGCCGDQVD